MSRRSINSHALKVRAHPWRVQIEIPAGGWREQADVLHDAARLASDDRFYCWTPSRPWPPVTTYAFATEAARDAFVLWVAENLPGRPWIAPPPTSRG